MKNIHFIINGLSPSARLLEKQVRRNFDRAEYPFALKYSEFPGHVIELTRASISEGATHIVACGGDGTINEVAQCLVNTPVILGILPIGSGNGLARHLGIPTKLPRAIALLKTFRHKAIDVGKANEQYFFCNVGVAFSAAVIRSYEQVAQRGLIGYFRAFSRAVSSFSYRPFQVEIGGDVWQTIPYVLLFSNTAQLGYNRTLTPDASLFDGKLDMILVERANLFAISIFTCFAFFGKFPSFTKIKRVQLEEARLRCPDRTMKIQMDGEIRKLTGDVLQLTIIPRSLKVICADA